MGPARPDSAGRNSSGSSSVGLIAFALDASTALGSVARGREEDCWSWAAAARERARAW